jgi:hypothetical protein
MTTNGGPAFPDSGLELLRRAVYACYRYFDHCEMVSVSAQHKGCDSGQMNVRMSLKDEAKSSIAAAMLAEPRERDCRDEKICRRCHSERLLIELSDISETHTCSECDLTTAYGDKPAVPAAKTRREGGSNMNKVTAEWLASQGAFYHDPWWCLREIEVWFDDDGGVYAINDKDGLRHINPTREQVLRMADGGLP